MAAVISPSWATISASARETGDKMAVCDMTSLLHRERSIGILFRIASLPLRLIKPRAFLVASCSETHRLIEIVKGQREMSDKFVSRVTTIELPDSPIAADIAKYSRYHRCAFVL